MCNQFVLIAGFQQSDKAAAMLVDKTVKFSFAEFAHKKS